MPIKPCHQEDPLVVLAQMANQVRRMKCIEYLLEDNVLPWDRLHSPKIVPGIFANYYQYSGLLNAFTQDG